jgi:uncharacterized membrane protein
MKTNDIREHILATYINLRVGIALLAFLLPFLLWLGGLTRADLPLQGSMSAYYHAGNGAMRDFFVGILFAVGLAMYLYRGYTALENWALNFAAIFLVGVAIIPMQWDCGNSCGKFSVHGTLAVLFFLSIAYVCIFRARDTLELMKDKAKAARYKKTYMLLGGGMVVLPLGAVLLSWILRSPSGEHSSVFFIEAVAVFVFASYWFVKTFEVKVTDSEGLAFDRRLKTRQYRTADIFKQVPVEHIV